MDKNQHGSKSKRSKLSHDDHFLVALENEDNVDVIYLDFAKEFDKVDHDILIKKFKVKMGMKGKL